LTYRIGAATITRVDECAFGLAPDRLFPDWDVGHGRFLQERLAPSSLDFAKWHVMLQTHLWVIEVNGMTVVVDAGIGNHKPRPFSKLFDMLDNPLLERFEAAGFRPEQIDYVLLTHLHVDHVGWTTHCQDGRWAPVFPNASYVFSEGERDYFHTPEGEPRRMVYEDSVLPLIDAGLAHAVPDTGAQIVDGIRMLATPGHSIAHMAIELRSQGEMAIFSGDVMHSPLQVYRPAWNSMFCLDQPQARASRAWLLDHAAQNDATIFAAHFPESSAGTVWRSGDGYEWQYLSHPTYSI
jgi:glyoxylase-like metal-dependent hydrolase (beta-lactamase superfamily II)